MDCRHITQFITDLNSKFIDTYRFLGADDPDKAFENTGKIDQMLWERREFFRFRKLEVSETIHCDIGSVIEQRKIKSSTWPIRLSGPNKEFLTFLRDDHIIETADIESGSGWAGGFLEFNNKPSSFEKFLWADADGGVFLQIRTDFGSIITYSENSAGTINMGGAKMPLLFAGVPYSKFMSGMKFGTYDETTLSVVSNNQLKEEQKFLEPSPSPERRIRKIIVSPTGKYVYTMDQINCLEWWNAETRSYGGKIAYTVLDFQPLLDNRSLVVWHGKILLVDAGQNIEYRPIIESAVVNGYHKIAVNRSEDYLYALNGLGQIDIFRMEGWERVGQIDISGRISDKEIKFLDVGAGDKIVIGLSDGEILVLQSKWKE